MKSTIDEPTNLDEPHFDEEATILAARPVVPLDEVKAKRSKGGLSLALAVGGGLLIGLLAATLIFRYLSADQPATEATVVEQPAQVAEQPSVEPPPSADGAVASGDEAPDESIADENPVVAEEPETQPEESRTVRTPERPSEVEPRRPVIVRDAPRPVDEDEDEEVDRATRRTQRQEERRERRAAVREANRQERQRRTTDDLTRIREIFEGTPRP